MLDPFGLSEAALVRIRALIVLVLLLAFACLTIWYGEWRADAARSAESAKYEVAIGKLKADAAIALGVQTGKVLTLERDLRSAHDEIEVMGHERETLSQDYERRLAAAAAAGGGRLRDPNAGRGCGGSGPAAPGAPAADAGAADRAEAGGLLSAPLTGLLRELTRDADRINDAYAACRADALTLRQQLSPP